MKVVNAHKRTINQPRALISELMKTLATNEDKVWPNRYWPPMRFKKNLKVGSQGGHGIIRYTVEDLTEGEYVKFKFSKPKGFIGYHEFQVCEVSNNSTQITHRIQITAVGFDKFKWLFVIRWLHDALIEDAFDNIENHFSEQKKRTKWTLWVKFWRFIFKLKL